ncbi:MAG: hypothetical protein QXX77_09050 [Candidatus Methanosuratincola sp.]
MRLLYLLIALVVMGVAGCAGGDDEGQDFGNLFDSPEGVVLTEEEHPTGWGRGDCFLCHPQEEIHQQNRTDFPGVLPIEDIQELVIRDGLRSCVICHGNNGVDE